jgi:hypothetical protein
LTRAAPAAIDSDVVLRAAAADSDDGGLSAAARIAIAIAGLALAWQRRGRASS